MLAVGTEAVDWLTGYAARCQGCRMDRLEGGAIAAGLARLPRYDLALVAGVLEKVPARSGAGLLAHLRDLHARRLLVLVHEGTASWDDAVLRGYGLRALGSWPEAGGARRLYEFDLYDYKATPDWLNPRHWAHPDLWDKFRW